MSNFDISKMHAFHIADTLSATEFWTLPHDLEWDEVTPAGHDADYILRKRALVQDLWNMYDPSPKAKQLTLTDTLTERVKKSAIQEFLFQEQAKDLYTEAFRTGSFIKKYDDSRLIDCPCAIQ